MTEDCPICLVAARSFDDELLSTMGDSVDNEKTRNILFALSDNLLGPYDPLISFVPQEFDKN